MTSTRLNNVTLTKSIIIGTYAFAKHSENAASGSAPSAFRWTVVVRSGESEDEDLSEYIQRIEFNLHSTFAQPRRVVEMPPFQLDEQGWGEFEIRLRIFFQDSNERPLELKHWLRLRPDENDVEAMKVDYTKQPLVHEQLEDIVFNSPHEWFYEKLVKPSNRTSLIPSVLIPQAKISQHPLRAFMKSIEEWRQEETENEKKLLEIEEFLRTQINQHQNQILLVDSEYRAYRDHFHKYNLSG